MRELLGTADPEISGQVVIVVLGISPARHMDSADELVNAFGLGLDMSADIWEHLHDRHSEPWERKQHITWLANHTALDIGDFTLVALDATPGLRPKTGTSA